MSCKVELIPISEGNRIAVKKVEKIIIGRGSSLGCNDKKISRQHAELLLKNDETLWIKPTHTNPVFYRTSHGKTIQLTKDIEQELKDGDQIGLLPTSFFFRISFSTDTNDNKDKLSTSSDQQLYRSTNNLDSNNHTDIKSTTIPSKDISSKTKSSDVEPKPYIQDTNTSTHVSLQDQNEFESTNSNKTPRKLPTWMIVSTSSSKTASTKTTSSSSCLYDSSSSDLPPTVKRQLNSEEDNNSNTKDLSNTSDIPVTNLSKSSLAKSFDSDSNDGFDSVSTKKIESNNKHRPACSYGASCYRKNLMHRTDQSHPGDSDYDDEEKTDNNDKKDDNDVDKPLCPYGKSCYRQNPQHKRDYKH
ncbi:unnamed protein product [Rotaria sordida]|uniref:Aprataxin and PNK-like factor n=1 Tax=Rotaria sordida TaxID=392033 RepID=A0A814QXZ5_9BILA|nr:unnamed protein product [Rotaria sordida]CAF3842322.1 unnamed protein product [Rotaria sordida]